METLSTVTQQASSMQRFIESLADRYRADLCQMGVSLTLTRLGQPNSLLLYNAGLDQAHLIRDPEGQLLPEVEFLFFTGNPDAWQPMEIRYALATWMAYLDATGKQYNDDASANNGEAMLNGFVAYWTAHLIEEGWLAAGQTCVRISGCQSTNHSACYGELWQCAACHRTFCCAEGTDNHPELCDDCWAARFAPEVVEDRSRLTFTAEGILELLCDCPEQCGTWLEFTADGVLALEDKDGLRVSILLPDWLDEAIRQAASQQQAALPKNDQETLNN